MSQAGHACVEALITIGRLEDDEPVSWDAGVPRVTVAPRSECHRIPPRTPTGLSANIMASVDLRIDPATFDFATGNPSGAGELRGWLSLPEDEPFDPCSLLYAVDAFPPATFEIAETGWVPTLELTVYVRALPAPGPLRILHRAG